MPSYSNLTALSSHLFIVGAIMLTPTSAAAGQYEGRVIVEWVEHDGSDRLNQFVKFEIINYVIQYLFITQ